VTLPPEIPENTRPASHQPRPPDHAHFRELLQAHLDGDITPADRMDLFDHLETCDECREMLEAEERLIRHLGSLPRLVPPSDLRARILKQVARERHESTTLMHGEESYRPLLEEPVLEWQADPDDEEGSELVSRPSIRPRTRWQRWSPVAATLFLAAASVTTFLAADLTAIPPLAAAQRLARAGGAHLLALWNPGPVRPRGTMMAERGRPAPAESTPMPGRFDIRQPTEPSATTTDLAAVLSRLPASTGDFLRTARGAVDRLADAASFDVPEPAEQSDPAMAAIVIRPTDGAEAFSFEDDFAPALRDGTAGARLASEDQFVSSGHRYRCYTVHAPSLWIERLVTQLGPYKTPRESLVLRALNEQGHGVSTPQSVAFFAVPGLAVKDALRVAESPSRDESDEREVRIFVVE
jgi:anti-sigma factor RsiW